MAISSAPLTTKDLERLCHSLGRAMEAGLPLLRALDVVESKSKRTRELLREVKDGIESGATLEEALRAQSYRLPPDLIEVLGAGERCGRLVDALHRTAAQFNERLRLRRALIVQSTYPACIVVAGTIIIPYFQGLFTAQLGPSGSPDALTYTLSFARGWAPRFAGFAAFLILLRLGVMRPVGRWCAAYLPFLTAYTRRMIQARFLWTLAMLLDSAVPLREAVARAAASTDSPWIRRDVGPVLQRLQHGANFSQAFAGSRCLRPMMTQMIAVGEQSGKLPELLQKAAQYLQEEAHHLAQVFTRLTNAILIILVGISILFRS